MRLLTLLVFFCFSFSLIACDNSVDKGKTTNTLSSSFSSLENKVKFLQGYLKPKSSFKALDYRIVYHDNSKGLVPGPSDWDIGLVAIVPPNEINQWIVGLNKNPQTPDIKWLSNIPTSIDYSKINQWFVVGFSSVVGINRELGLVVYRNVTN